MSLFRSQSEGRPVRAGAATSATTAPSVLTVTALTRLVRQAITSALPGTLHVVGQISNYKAHSSGHRYFTLKDAESEVSCVFWRQAAKGMKFTPTDGLEVVVTGALDVFERTGRYQLYVQRIEPHGIGPLELAFRQMKAKLEAEGLFDPRHKKPLPFLPRRLVVITSPTGAALRDVLRTLGSRCPSVDVLVIPVCVQGAGAAEQIAGAIRRVNRASSSIDGIDVILLARGGGSIEDLWAFNEDVVARAIFASAIPIVSAIGHETDVTICDLVADARAATPTAGAQLAVPSRDELLSALDQRRLRLKRDVDRRLDAQRRELAGIGLRRAFREPLTVVQLREQRVDDGRARLVRRFFEIVGRARQGVDRAEPRLHCFLSGARLVQAARRLHLARQRCAVGQLRRLLHARSLLAEAGRRMDRCAPQWWVRNRDDRMAEIERRLAAVTRRHRAMLAERVAALEQLLSALSYKGVLRRGFSITRLKRTGAVLRRACGLPEGTRLITEVSDGWIESSVVDARQLDLFEPPDATS